ncbi:cupin domain-containing protein [Kineosporia sp. J2-2]|uniref:Cupin domain-containing protein n=1 Tax=Kineosporia corallincola TaxID=2835133 RepID=A0ABS5TRE9_9ACTN|nr:cupin domain-containing protein [Kineosporia corallincola]MBT0773375.1 cupin domain-containing protein [Kineosporia corallincola]
MTRVLDTSSPIPLAAVESSMVDDGKPTTGSRPLTALAGLEIGVWEMTTGTARDIEADEVFVVLSGSATVTFDDGDVIELGPGVLVRLHAGDSTSWVVHETLRKVYVV